MRAFPLDERRARLGERHHLAAPADDLVTAARAVVGLHASDPSTPYLSARARTQDFSQADLERALYDDRELVRTTLMRKTLFVVGREDIDVLTSAVGPAFAIGDRRRLEHMLQSQGIAEEPGVWLDDVAQRVIDELAARGEATAVELREVIPELRESLTFGEGKSWGGTTGISTRVLFMLAAGHLIVRGRPLGAWTSSRYRWALLSAWLGRDLHAVDPTVARSTLCRRYLTAYGPATFDDLRWWTGWTAGDASRALVGSGATEVDLDGASGWALPDDLEPTEVREDWIALLPALDPTTMGWKNRSWYLSAHADRLFDGNGNAGPTIWWNGQVVGGWAQRKSGEIAVRLLEVLPRAARERVDAEAEALERWLGAVRVMPRFRTPLEREITER